MMIPFSKIFPRLAEKETRTLMLFNELNEFNLPSGKYGFLESYCSDPSCDCRRVFLNVAYFKKVSPSPSDRPSMVATIGYGWDTLEHYDKWFGVNGEKTPHNILINLKGPILELGGYHT